MADINSSDLSTTLGNLLDAQKKVLVETLKYTAKSSEVSSYGQSGNTIANNI
jgi:hypothetical protein